MTYKLGITTFRKDESENLNRKAFHLTKKGNIKQASKEVVKTINKELFNKTGLNLVKNTPTIGIYEGGKEPSSSPEFQTNISKKKLLNIINKFKIKSKQDSIILYKESKWGYPALRIIPKTSSIQNFQKELLKITGDKIGKYLTYNPKQHEFTILNIPELDNINPKDFIKLTKDLEKISKKVERFYARHELI